MKQWYAINTKANCEAFAKASLHHLRIEVFLPLLREIKAIHGKGQPVLVPLFPGYLFVRCELPTQYRAVAYAAGVKQFVSFGSGPAVVDEAVIDILTSQLEDGVLERPEHDFRPGQVVRINNGTLNGVEAIFERHVSGAQRAVLLLRALSYHARVVVQTRFIANL